MPVPWEFEEGPAEEGVGFIRTVQAWESKKTLPIHKVGIQINPKGVTSLSQRVMAPAKTVTADIHELSHLVPIEIFCTKICYVVFTVDRSKGNLFLCHQILDPKEWCVNGELLMQFLSLRCRPSATKAGACPLEGRSTS